MLISDDVFNVPCTHHTFQPTKQPTILYVLYLMSSLPDRECCARQWPKGHALC